MAEPLYRKIQFDTDLRSVWDKLAAGWDWLGVDVEGEFVLGWPRREPRAVPGGEVTIGAVGATPGEHGVRVESPVERPTVRWFASEARARQEFGRIVDDLRQRQLARPILTLVQRVEGGRVVEELFVGPPAGR